MKKRCRNWVFTINNYTQKEVTLFRKFSSTVDKHVYICYGLEIAPSTGTKHIQGYIQLREGMTISAVQKYFNIIRKGKLLKFHLQEARGSYEQNKKYVSKSGEFFEFGEPKKQGSRSDLDFLRLQVSDNPNSFFDVIRNDVQNFQQLKFVESFVQYQRSSYVHDIKFFWVVGNPIELSHLLIQHFGINNISRVSNLNWLGQDYKGEPILFIDFPDINDLPYATIQKMMSPFGYSLPRKGSAVPLVSKVVIFSSPVVFSGIYSSMMYPDLPGLKQISLQDFSNYDIKEIQRLL